jgi:hypothetical protein
MVSRSCLGNMFWSYYGMGTYSKTQRVPAGKMHRRIHSSENPMCGKR